jgi:hypothetical protein
VNGASGTQLDEAGEPSAEELAHRGRHLPPAVVASLGTNDDPHGVSSFEHAVGSATYAGFDRVLDRLAAKHDNLRVVDWLRWSATTRGWIGDDGVYPDATGYMARARAIARQVRRCRRSLAE